MKLTRLLTAIADLAENTLKLPKRPADHAQFFVTAKQVLAPFVVL